MESKEIISNIKLIYSKYPIPKNLQRHMLHVASVAELICDNCKEKVDKDSVVASCLIHDLGNIVKMNFVRSETINLMDEEDKKRLDYFIKKQKEFIEKYGSSDLEANIKIAKELGVSDNIVKLVDHRAIQIENGKFVLTNIEEKIASYADMRVDPNGVVSLENRLKEYQKRYQIEHDKERFAKSLVFSKLILGLEKELFTKINILPSEITQDSTKKYYEKFLLLLK